VKAGSVDRPSTTSRSILSSPKAAASTDRSIDLTGAEVGFPIRIVSRTRARAAAHSSST
jgi:hypothetical protein